MSRHHSTDEVRIAHVAALGQDLGELFTVLENALTLIFWRWQQYRALYGGGQARFDLMNGSGSFFFWTVQQMIWEDTLLAIARLTAGPKSAGKSHLTMQRVGTLISDTQLRASVQEQVDTLVRSTAFAKVWRDRRLAHRALDLAMGTAAQPLPPTSVPEVEDALTQMASILNAIGLHYMRSTTAFQNSPIIGGALDVLYAIRDGERVEALRQRHLEAGEYRPEEWSDGDPAL